MKYRMLFVAAAITLAVAFSSHASFQDPANTSEKPLYQPSGNEASVSGTITVNGEVPRAKKIDMSADPPCEQVNKKRTVESLLVNDQRLVNAFVYIKEGDGLNAYRFQVPESEVVLEHKGCQYSPRVLGIRVGQRLSIVNADPTTHNTHAVPKNNPEWNQSQPPAGPPFLKTFTRAELLIPLKDNQHPWERSYISVMRHPFFAVSDEQGNYEIRGLPPGTYQLVIWHEVLGEQEIELTLKPNESQRLDVLVDGEKARTSAKPKDYPWD
jgi:plastocyanin